MKKKEDKATTLIAVKLKLDVAGDVEGADGVGVGDGVGVSGMKEEWGRDGVGVGERKGDRGDGGDEEGVAC